MKSSFPAIDPASPRPWSAASMLCWRETTRFFRQRNRIVGAIGTPLLFWLLFGAGLDRSFRMSTAGDGQQGFREFFFPGSIAMILLFTSIFAAISIIEDRREGFLQSVLVSPVPRWSMVLGKVLGGSWIALLQGAFFSLLVFMLPGATVGWTAFIAALGFMFLISIALTALGYVFAWRMDSTQGFHAIMNLVLMPMWLLSGSFFPVPSFAGDSSGGVMHWIMKLNPLTYGVSGLRWMLFGDVMAVDGGKVTTQSLFWVPTLSTCWCVTILFALVTLALAWKVSESRTTGDLL